MTDPNLTLAVITDEIADSLTGVLAFAAEEDLAHIEIRQLDGANFLSLDEAAWRAAAKRIRDAGLTVTGLATPLLKGPAPGRPFTLTGDQFGFDPRSAPFEVHAERVMQAADIFGARNVRIFSYLTTDDFRIGELDEPFGYLLTLAEKNDVMLQLENEPVCNVASVADGVAAVSRFAHPRLKLLLDIGNAACIGQPPSVSEIGSAMAHVTYAHVKDWSAARGRYVPLGEGDTNWPEALSAIRAGAAGRPLTLSVETHCHAERPEATRSSWRLLMKMVEAGA